MEVEEVILQVGGGYAAVLGLIVLLLLILGVWKLAEVIYYLYLRAFRSKDLRIKRKIRKAKKAS